MNTDREQSEETKQSRWGLRGKTAWDWLQLLVVPLMLALITVVFTWQQDARQQKIENQRAAAERELAKQRAQDEALQAYFDQMSTLMLENKLRSSEEDSEARTLARARTLTVLRRVDTSRRDEVIQFLLEADLLHRVGESAPVIELGRADLRDANLLKANLSGADLREVDLRGAYLYKAKLGGANLFRANLSGAIVGDANLEGANLEGANLSDAFLSRADLSDANLKNVDLSRAELYRANLSGANLSDAHLLKANLSEANLSNTNLTDANLYQAKEVTNEQLSAASSLEGAQMPDGQDLKDIFNPDGPTFEEWLKSQGRKDNGKSE
jgi:uncharacterized protein YjbI with pentapeptide repeats